MTYGINNSVRSMARVSTPVHNATRIASVSTAAALTVGAVAAVWPQSPSSETQNSHEFAVMGVTAGAALLSGITGACKPDFRAPAFLAATVFGGMAVGAGRDVTRVSRQRIEAEDADAQRRVAEGIGRLTVSPEGTVPDILPDDGPVDVDDRVLTRDSPDDSAAYIVTGSSDFWYANEHDAVRAMLDDPGKGAVLQAGSVFAHVDVDTYDGDIPKPKPGYPMDKPLATDDFRVVAVETGDFILRQGDGDRLYLVTDIVESEESP